MERPTKKFYGMDEKLNILTNLMFHLTTLAREGKRKYDIKSAKKKVRTYVER